jgi:hypothetical protein
MPAAPAANPLADGTRVPAANPPAADFRRATGPHARGTPAANAPAAGRRREC